MSEKVSDDVLADRLDECPKVGRLWRHYKSGNAYRVLGRAISEATQQPLVIYESPIKGITFARPLAEWEEQVEYEGKTVARFTRV